MMPGIRSQAASARGVTNSEREMQHTLADALDGEEEERQLQQDFAENEALDPAALRAEP